MDAPLSGGLIRVRTPVAAAGSRVCTVRVGGSKPPAGHACSGASARPRATGGSMEQPHVRGDMAEHPGVCDDSDRVGLDGTNGVS